MIELSEIQVAADRLAGKIFRTPLFSSKTLGELTQSDFHLKCECFQKTGSFKARGALNKILSLSASQKRKGLITVSAGNHAQAVAWAAQLIGAPCAVVMPSGAPRSKIDAVRGYGAEVILHPDRATLFDRLDEEQKIRGSVFVHPFDDPTVLAGAGTAGLEIMEDLPQVDAVIVPVGGGGLIGGVASAVKSVNPRVRVVGVELEEGPGLKPALDAGRPVPVRRPPDTLADGMTPPFVGAIPLEIAREAVDDVVAVGERDMVETMRLLMTRCKICVEAAGAAATAALLYEKVELSAGSRVVALVSGGNIDPEIICRVFQEDE